MITPFVSFWIDFYCFRQASMFHTNKFPNDRFIPQTRLNLVCGISFVCENNCPITGILLFTNRKILPTVKSPIDHNKSAIIITIRGQISPSQTQHTAVYLHCFFVLIHLIYSSFQNWWQSAQNRNKTNILICQLAEVISHSFIAQSTWVHWKADKQGFQQVPNSRCWTSKFNS
jgi:hypothetical protein